MKNCLCVVLMILSGTIVLADVREDLSGTSFTGTDAKKAQDAYNQAVREAWQSYQSQVIAAGRKYSSKLEEAYKKEVSADNLQEALKIKREMEQFTFDFTKGLVLYMSFDKQGTDEKVLDNSGMGNNGKAEGVAWTDQGVSGGAGQFEIRDRTDRIVVPDSDSLDCKTITICAWIKTDDNDEFWNRIIDKEWRKGYALCLGGGSKTKYYWGKVFFELDQNSVIGSDVSVADNMWHQVIARYDGEYMELYVDGHLQKARTRRPGQMMVNAFPLAIGNTYPGYDVDEFLAFNGMIDEVAIYNRALSEREIQAMSRKNADSVFPEKSAGIGVKLRNHPQGVIVDEVFNPAVGLKKGDIILGADGNSFADKSLMQAMKALHGAEGTTVLLDVKDSGGAVKKVRIVRMPLSDVGAGGSKK